MTLMTKIPESGSLNEEMASAIRVLAMDAVQAANSGHPGAPMGLADAATVLFAKHIKIDPTNPNWPDRDRFVLSAGHASMLQYALHYLLGYEDMSIDQVRNFRQLGAITAGHPEYGHAAGVEMTTGPLGQGLSSAVGMALTERMLNARFGDDLVDHFTWVMAGDGCLMEGVSHEAIDFAGHMKLGRLVVLWDDNSITIDGATNLSTSMNQLDRFRAAGWHVQSVDGHDMDAIDAAMVAAKEMTGQPSLIAMKTVIGKGAPNKAGSSSVHGAPLGDAEIAGARLAMNWNADPFEIPAPLLDQWRAAGLRSTSERKAWEARLEDSSSQAVFTEAMSDEVPEGLHASINRLKADLSSIAPKVATRKASQMALEVVNDVCAHTIGGSADLTGSNNTKTDELAAVLPDDFAGRYIHYGVREHAMAAIMNGMAVHKGFIPYGGTFLVFAGYMLGAMRLSALMQQRVIYVLSHDSIGLGEDGPTHQPVETLATLRALPNMHVFRPADAVETAEAWECALTETSTPSVLALSRQGLPTLRTAHKEENLTSKGGYVIREAQGVRDVTLIATGSEVHLAVEAAIALGEEGVRAAVISMPCWELFDAQSESYRNTTLGKAPRIAVEAATGMGWERYTRNPDAFVGMNGFGASAPAEELYHHFNITADAVADKARALLRL